MATQFGRKLTDGLLARLEFDYSCNRGHSFGEYYLHGVANEIISANVDPAVTRVYAGHAHHAIEREKRSRGRGREVDFYVEHRRIERGGAIEERRPVLCVEVKWANSSHAKPHNVVKDLLRLALVKQAEPSVECLFILAGGNAAVESLLSTPPIAAASEKGRRLLERPRAARYSRKRAFPLVDRDGPVVAIQKATESFTSIPPSISTTLVTPASFETKRWQVLIWRVESP